MQYVIELFLVQNNSLKIRMHSDSDAVENQIMFSINHMKVCRMSIIGTNCECVSTFYETIYYPQEILTV